MHSRDAGSEVKRHCELDWEFVTRVIMSLSLHCVTINHDDSIVEVEGGFICQL